MNIAKPFQKIQDWITQQWVILTGKELKNEKYNWLIGPFGTPSTSNDEYIRKLASDENLQVISDAPNMGLLSSIDILNLTPAEQERLNPYVKEFYERTSHFDLQLEIKWNPFFKFFGVILNLLFSKRLQQLHIPVKGTRSKFELTNNILYLTDSVTNNVKYTFWKRTVKSTNKDMYSGIYSVCTCPKGDNLIKAVFPLPNGNATVLLKPTVGKNGELVLDATGKSFGDAGFYFQLKDNKGKLWAKHITSFKDTLTVEYKNEELLASQSLTFSGLKVLDFKYRITRK
ncbi:MAG: hypothetical protein ACJAZ2_001367 [Glaciecola sp.]|jgi:hypothetical protein